MWCVTFKKGEEEECPLALWGSVLIWSIWGKCLRSQSLSREQKELRSRGHGAAHRFIMRKHVAVLCRGTFLLLNDLKSIIEILTLLLLLFGPVKINSSHWSQPTQWAPTPFPCGHYHLMLHAVWRLVALWLSLSPPTSTPGTTGEQLQLGVALLLLLPHICPWDAVSLLGCRRELWAPMSAQKQNSRTAAQRSQIITAVVRALVSNLGSHTYWEGRKQNQTIIQTTRPTGQPVQPSVSLCRLRDFPRGSTRWGGATTLLRVWSGVSHQ